MLSQKLKKHKINYLQDEFSTIHLNYQNIKVIDKFGSKFCFIEELYLNHNNLLSLSGIEGFKNLKIFHFKFNRIEAFQELYKIQNPFFMISLAAIGNPMQMDRRSNFSYLRSYLFKNLCQYNPSCVEYYKKLKIKNKATTDIAHYYTPASQKKEKKIFLNSNQLNEKDKYQTASTAQDFYNKNNIIQQKSKYFFEQSQHKKNIIKQSLSILNKQNEEENKRQEIKISQFINQKNKQQEQSFLNSAKTAKFDEKIQENNEIIETQRNEHITLQFIQNEKLYLAEEFYIENLYQKYFNRLKMIKYLQNPYETQLKLLAFMNLKKNLMSQKLNSQYKLKKYQLLNHKLNDDPQQQQ